MKKYFVLSVLLACCFVSRAYDFSDVAPTGQTLYYNIISSSSLTVAVTSPFVFWSGYTRPTGSLTIPSTVSYDGITYSVTSIGEQAFQSCSGLTSVTIPNSVTSIGSYAFNGCSSLTSISIPNSVISIGSDAFSICVSLTSVTIPNSVISIGSYAFNGCSSLTSISIPNSVISIGNFAFENCSGLTGVTIGNSVISIGSYVFSGCSSLTVVTIPSSVASIGLWAFNGVEVVNYCGSASGSPWGATRVVCGFYGEGDFLYQDSTKTTLIAYVGSASSVAIPNTVTSIWERAFYGCSGLTSVTIGNSVTSIGEQAFYGCSGLTNVTIPNSVTSIGEQAFYSCSGLTSVTIGNSVTTIGYAVFYECSSLTSVTIGNSVTSIGEMAFYNCSGLTSVTIPNSVTSIADYAFRYCSNLTGITIGNSVISIGRSAFSGCSGLTSVIIPNSVTTIGSGAFFDCGGLDTVFSLNPTAPTLGSFCFDYCPIQEIYIPCGSMASYSARWSSYSNFLQESDSPFERVLQSVNDTMGSVSLLTSVCADTSTILATPNYGYHFTQWSDGDTINPRTFVLTQDTSFTAQFGYNSYVIFKSCDTIQGNVMGEDSADYLSDVTLTATPNYGYHFTQWSDGVTDNPRTFVLTQDTSFTAQFGYSSYAVTKVCDTLQGNVMGEDSADYLSNVVLTAEPNYGYHFTQWSDGVTDNPRTFILTQDTTFVAEFDRNSYAVTCVSNDVSMGQVQGGGTFLYLDTVALSAVAVEPYRFTHWQDGDTVNPRSIVVYSDSTFTAYFENSTEGIETVQKSYTLTVVGNAIRISGAMGETVRVFDVVGRQLLIKKLDSEEILLDQTGVFFVQVGNAPTEKVVLVR